MISLYEKYFDNQTKSYKYSNLGAVSAIKFPGGELHCQLSAVPAKAILVARVTDWEDFGELLTVTNAVKNVHKLLEQDTELHLVIPYVPGGRQDRISNIGEPFTLKVYTDIINAQNYDSVTTIDPHSTVTEALINNLKTIDVSRILHDLVDENQYDTIIIPDAGAAKKTFSVYFPDKLNVDFIQCLKKRDTVTGKLSGFRVIDDLPRFANILVVDDICDGGGTFLGLAEEIEKFRPKTLDLYITHGIFSKGTNIIRSKYDRVYTTNSFYYDYNEEELEVDFLYKIEDFLFN